MSRLLIRVCCLSAFACTVEVKSDTDPIDTADETEETTTPQGDLEVFDVHFVVLTSAAAAPTDSSVHVDPFDPTITYTGAEALFRREIEILNTFFVQEDRSPVGDGRGDVTFAYRSHSTLADIAGSGCDLEDFGDLTDPKFLTVGTGLSPVLSSAFEVAVQGCTDPDLVDPGVVHFFVYDIYHVDKKTSAVVDTNVTSHGRSTEIDGVYVPYVLIDVARLMHAFGSAEEHEMGHAFSLGHVCDPAIVGSAPGNIMQREGCVCDPAIAPGGQGDRGVGFGTVDFDIGDSGCETLDQVEAIVDRAELFQSTW